MTNSTFIVIAGNIGVGKSSLTTQLGEHFGWQTLQEAERQNPYLQDFYQDMRRWGFHSQIFFLTQRLKQLANIDLAQTSLIQDRSLYEDAEIFARNLAQQGLLSERDFQTYLDLYLGIRDILPKPNLIVYLAAPVGLLTERIALRGREYEQRISIAYLRDLNRLYDQWVKAWDYCPIMTIQAQAYDFVHQSEHFELMVDQIKKKLESL